MKKFEDLVYDKYGSINSFEEVLHAFNSIRKTLTDSVKGFERFSDKKQYEYCVPVYFITMHTLLQHMNENPIIRARKEKKEYKYSIKYRFKGKETLNLEDKGLING